jgi:sec-independent protein translocase protein TatB
MLDLGWTEIVVIAIVAILVVGPKDLPRMLRSFGQTLGQLRRSANEFKRQFDDALREAEREADFEDTRKSVQSFNPANPLADLKKSVEKDLNPANKTAGAKPKPPNGSDDAAEAQARPADKAAKPVGKAAGQKRQSAGKPAAAKAKPAGAAKAEPGPASTGSANGGEARRDSDAA